MIMVKTLKKMSWMLATTLMMTACSDSLDDSLGNDNNGDTTDGTGYVKIALNLPSTSGTSTRTSNLANDQFYDGLNVEYNVNDVIMALFYGASEADATCKWAKRLDPNPNFSDDPSGNITTKSTFVVEDVLQPQGSEKVYALAIVNNSGYFGTSTSNL